jgi:predicted DNA-binding transcriptional regulator YafY
MSKTWPYRWDLLLRYRLIEIIALWEGRLTTNHLGNAFGIGRQQASKDINTYLAEIAPGNLVYDRHLKGYKPSERFRPVLTKGTADEYLHWLGRNEDLINTFALDFLQTPNLTLLTPPVQQIAPDTLRKIIRAARQQLRLETEYVSFNQPDPETRIIAPHTLVFTGLRWHVRAWCEKNREFRDFVLSRFRGLQELMDFKTEHTEVTDSAWNTPVTIEVAPDPRLSISQKEIVIQDYRMVNERWLITVRAALAIYVLQLLKIDKPLLNEDPAAQQIVLVNRKELKPWLF